jgi:predicted ribosomally synthesized peptide with nif11-like leader
MSHKAAREFLEKANNDTSFREKNLPPASASWDEKTAAAVRVGPQFGYQFTAQELKDVETVKSFWRKVTEDDKLRAKLQAVATSDPKATPAAVAKIASEAGFAVSPALLEEVTQGGLAHVKESGELSEADLEQVAGGATLTTSATSTLVSSLSSPSYQKVAVQSTIMCPW